MALNLEDDKIITALRQTLQHISHQQKKFKNIDVELQETKQEFETERNNYSNHCCKLKTQIKELHDELDHFRSKSQEQSTIISEMQIKSAKQSQQNTELMHQLKEKDILMEEIKIKNEQNAHTLVQKLEEHNQKLHEKIATLQLQLDTKTTDNQQLEQLQHENKSLQQKILKLETEFEDQHKIFQQQIYNKQQMEEQHVIDIKNRVQELKDKNVTLQQQYEELQQLKEDTTIKYQNYCGRMSQMGQCSFGMLQNCRDLRRCITDTTSHIVDIQQNIKTEFHQTLQKIDGINVKKEDKAKTNELQIDQIKINLKYVKETKSSLIELRNDVEKELINFDKDIKSIQRAIFKQKTMIRKQIKKKEEDMILSQMENEQNMEERLEEYLKQKEDLQNKINELEIFLKDKNEKDIITEMKRFRSAAIVTSVTSLSEDGGKTISYHELSEHERKAISLKSKLEKQLNSEININEKVDEFIRCGGLKRYPILEQEFVYQPHQTDNNRFRFGQKYISVSYNIKNNQLYVKNENDDNSSSQLLQIWITKNASNEMRKLLAKVSQKKKTNKPVLL